MISYRTPVVGGSQGLEEARVLLQAGLEVAAGVDDLLHVRFTKPNLQMFSNINVQLLVYRLHISCLKQQGVRRSPPLCNLLVHKCVVLPLK